MRIGLARAVALIVAAASLAGCGTAGNFLGLKSASSGLDAQASAPAAEDGAQQDPNAQLLGADPDDDLSRAKKYFRTANYGLAEQHFRRAVELHPRDAEAWLGLAASYDRLRRFDLADRAYAQATRIAGPTVEILNNEGFSYMLRGDYKRAHAKLVAAQQKAPDNPYVKNNLRLLAESAARKKSIR